MAIQYVGNKQKIAKDILKIILPENEQRPYYEPFVGSGAFLCEVPVTMQRFANDKNPYMVALLTAVRDGWIPQSEVSEEDYNSIRRAPSNYPPELVGFVSVGCSFGGKMWGGYARQNKDHLNYAAMSARSILKSKEPLQGVTFTTGEYFNMSIPDGALVYCDPPYQVTTGYEYSVSNFGDFWRWVKGLVERGCQVFISGYSNNKVTGWDIVWKKQINTQLGRNETSARNQRFECLFQHESQSGQVHEAPKSEPVMVDCCPTCGATDPALPQEGCLGETFNQWHGDL